MVLRHALSDHSLYKPSFNSFMQAWNHPEFFHNDQLLNVDRLAALAFSMREKELAEQELANLSESELRENRRQEKRARRERRRNSVLIMMQTQREEYAATLPRACSTPDIRPRRPEKSKRVAFTLEPFSLPLRYGDAVKPLPPINRPILIKKRKISCLPPNEVPHVDYETFAAWRRGRRERFTMFAKTVLLLLLLVVCIANAQELPLDNANMPGSFGAHLQHTVMAIPKAAADCRLSITVVALGALFLSRMSLDVAQQEMIIAHHKELKARLEAQRKQKSILANLTDAFKACFVHRSARTSPVDWMQ